MFREVTAAQAVLEPRTAAEEIDRVLRVALETSKPVYLGIPLDVAPAPVPADALRLPLTGPDSDPWAAEEFRAALEPRLARESGICVLAGPRLHRRGMEDRVAELATLPGVRLATQAGVKALLDEDHPASLGTYFRGAAALSFSTWARDRRQGSDAGGIAAHAVEQQRIVHLLLHIRFAGYHLTCDDGRLDEDGYRCRPLLSDHIRNWLR